MYVCTSQNTDKFPESTEITTWTNDSSLPAKSIVERWWNYRWLTFAYFRPFLGLKYRAGPDGSKKFFKPMNIDCAFEALWKLATFRYGGFEFKAGGNKWWHETDEEEEECKKPRKQAPIRQLFKKGCVGISESNTYGALLLEKVFCDLWSRMT